MKAIERPDLVGPSYKHNNHRVEHQAEIENAISSWTQTHTAEEVESILNGIGVPVGRVCSVKEIVEGEQIKARGGVEDVWVPSSKLEGERGWTMKMPMVAPILEGCNPKTRWAGPDLGSHNGDVLVEHLGLSEEEVKGLVDRGVVGAFSSKLSTLTDEGANWEAKMGEHKQRVDRRSLGQ